MTSDLEEQSMSVLLVKPDGYRSTEVRDRIDKLLEQSDLSIRMRYAIELDEVDILDVWPRFGQAKFRFTLTLLNLYMTSGLSEAVIVSGPDVVDRCVAIRNAVRDQFGTSAFANCVHAPTEPSEIEPIVRKFLHSIPAGTPFERPGDAARTKGVWGQLAAESTEDIKAAAESFWTRQETGGWDSAWRTPPEGGPFATRLLPGDANSIDFGMSALYELFPEWTLEDVIAAYVEAEVAGSCLLYAGDRDSADRLTWRLREFDMYAETVPAERD